MALNFVKALKSDVMTYRSLERQNTGSLTDVPLMLPQVYSLCWLLSFNTHNVSMNLKTRLKAVSLNRQQLIVFI